MLLNHFAGAIRTALSLLSAAMQQQQPPGAGSHAKNGTAGSLARSPGPASMNTPPSLTKSDGAKGASLSMPSGGTSSNNSSGNSSSRSSHSRLVIGLSAGLGAPLLLALLAGVWSEISRARRQQYVSTAWSVGGSSASLDGRMLSPS